MSEEAVAERFGLKYKSPAVGGRVPPSLQLGLNNLRKLVNV